MGRAVKWMWALPLTLAAAGLVSAAPQRYEMKSYVQIGGKVRPAFAWCDAPDRVIGVTQPARNDLKTPQPIKLRQVLKRPAPNTDAFDYVADYRLGPSDPGAGQVYTAITFPESGGRYFIHTSNVENVNDPAYRMTRVNEFRTPEGDFRCRYQPQAAFMGATNKRTVIVWESGGKITYGTRNFDGSGGVFLQNGHAGYRSLTQQAERTEAFTRLYSWNAPDGFRYSLDLTEKGSVLKVQKNGKTLQTEPFLAYSVSLPQGRP